MTRLRPLVAGLVASVLAAAIAAAQNAPAPAPLTTERVGRSVEGRPITLARLGDPAAPRKVLVVGCVHGDECAGRAIVDDLARRRTVPDGAQLLLIRVANPDGLHRGTRQNAHGVDLNRNASQGWRPLTGAQAAGRRPWSEPESRALRAVILRERPALAVWYHQPLALVDPPEAGDPGPARRYARLVELRLHRLPAYPGSLSRWTNARLRAGSSFVVELGRGRLTATAAARHAEAILALSRSPGRPAVAASR